MKKNQKLTPAEARRLSLQQQRLQHEGLSQLVKVNSQLLRVDLGGRDVHTAIAEDASVYHYESAERVGQMLSKQIEGSRKRMKPRTDLLKERLAEIEKLTNLLISTNSSVITPSRTKNAKTKRMLEQLQRLVFGKPQFKFEIR